jgi:hypothetical protein
MTISKLRVVVFAGGLLAVAAAGCGSSEGAPSNGGSALPASAATTTAAASGLPTRLTDPNCGEVPAALEGKWTKTLGPEDLTPELFDADTGVFVMTLGPGHLVRTDVDKDHPGVDEDFCWTPDHAVYVTDRDDCDNDSLGTYEWVLRDDALDFTEVHDECFWRPWQMTLRVWERVLN